MKKLKNCQKGGSIHINPKNKGKFTASARAAGMGVQEFAAHVLANKEDYSSTQVKRANFARNASKFHHEDGGPISFTGYLPDSPDFYNPFNIIPSNEITMQGVEFPVYGIDDYGNEQMMYPGQDYTFPGNYVTEYPIKRDGGIIKDNGKSNFLKKFNIFNVVNSPKVDMFDSTIIKAQYGGMQRPWEIPTQSFRPDEFPDNTTAPATPTDQLSIRDYLKFQNPNQIMNRATSNLMNDLIDPGSFYNMLGYADAGISAINNSVRNRRQQDWLISQRNTDNLTPTLPGGDRGDYVVNGSAYGMFRPDELGAKSPYGMTQGMYYPSMQMGGQIRKPTAIDSADLYRNSSLVRGYYSNLRGYQPHPAYDDYGRIKQSPKNIYKALDESREDMMTRSDNIMVPGTGGKRRWADPDKTDFYKKVDDNRFFQRELSTGSLDTRAPKTLYDRRIVPSDLLTLVNSNKKDQMYGDFVEIPTYDPAKIKPWNMLSPEEKQVRMKEQGIVPTKAKPVSTKKSGTRTTVVPPEYAVPNDLQWTDIETPTYLPEVKINAKKPVVTYPFGKRGETMTQEEWDYTRKKRGYPDVYSDRKQGGTDNFIPGEIYSNEVRNDIMEFRKLKKEGKLEYGGQTSGNSFALELNDRRITMTSYDEQNPISKTLYPVDEDEANIEAELGETIFGDFDNDGVNEHMKVAGRKHSQGGTPLAVPPASFVYSDAKKLQIGGEILEVFGKNKDTKKKYTPADLAKQYDINKYKQVIDDPNSDPITRKTAELMINNYNNKLGQLALVQESKKGFPDGIPQVAIPYLMSQVGPGELVGTNVPNNDQYFATGGQYDPLKGIDPATGLPIDPYRGGRTTAGTITPTGRQNPYNRKADHLTAWEQIIPGIRSMDNAKAQSLMYQYNLTNNPQSIKDMWSTYGLTAKGLRNKELSGLANKGVLDPSVLTPENLAKLETAYADGYFGVRQMDPIAPRQLPNIPTRTINPKGPGILFPPSQIPETTEPNEFIATSGQQAPTDFWTQDKINTAYALGNRADLKKYLPWAAPITGVTADPTFYDPNRELANNAELMNTEMMYNAQFSGPQSLGVRNSSVSGNAATNAANILGRYNNQNVGVANQFEMQNAEFMNQLSAAEAARANNLYQGTVIANQQFDNARSQANDVIRKNLLSGLDNKQKTQWINSWYPQYDLDPSTGYINFAAGTGRSTITPAGAAPMNLTEAYLMLKQKYPTASEEILREQAKQMTGQATNTVNSDGDVTSRYKGPTPAQLQQLLKFQGG